MPFTDVPKSTRHIIKHSGATVNYRMIRLISRQYWISAPRSHDQFSQALFECALLHFPQTTLLRIAGKPTREWTPMKYGIHFGLRYMVHFPSPFCLYIENIPSHFLTLKSDDH